MGTGRMVERQDHASLLLRETGLPRQSTQPRTVHAREKLLCRFRDLRQTQPASGESPGPLPPKVLVEPVAHDGLVRLQVLRANPRWVVAVQPDRVPFVQIPSSGPNRQRNTQRTLCLNAVHAVFDLAVAARVVVACALHPCERGNTAVCAYSSEPL